MYPLVVIQNYAHKFGHMVDKNKEKSTNLRADLYNNK